MAKPQLPELLNVCLVDKKFQTLGRTAEHGFLWLIARGLARRGHSVTILAAHNPYGKTEMEADGVRAFFLLEPQNSRRRVPFDIALDRKFRELHKAQPFHILHSLNHDSYRITKQKKELKLATAFDVDATQMSQIFSILGMATPTLGSILSTDLAIVYKFLQTFFGGDRQLLNSADGVFVTSPQQRVLLERYYLYPDLRIHTVPYGIEIGDLSPRERSVELRQKLGIPMTGKTIVTINDMTDVHEMRNLFIAFERVVVKKPNSRLIVLGTGPKLKEIEFEMLNLALGSKVVLAGAIKTDEVPDYISLSDIFVNLSSRTTGFEPSLLEAMAQKKVIIGSEVSPIATIVEHGKEGFLIRPADTSELTSILLEIINGHLPTADIGENARQKVLNLFDSQKMVTETINAYYNILRSTGYYRKYR